MDDGELRLGGMTSEQTDKLFQFQDLTGIEDVSVCRDVLQRHGWDLEVAVQVQLNLREGRPSMFAVSARQPNVVSDYLAQQHFHPVPRDDGRPPGLTGLFRYVIDLLVRLCYNTVTAVFNVALQWIRPDPRKQLTDPLRDVLTFVNSFEEKYGDQHPVFYQGTYAQALNDAKQELRFLLVYLHNENYPEAEKFCRVALADEDVIRLINEQMLFWACSVNTGEGYRVSQAMREREYPFLAVIVIRDAKMTIVARLNGDVSGPELARRLQTVVRDNEPHIIAARAERMERSFNQSLREQQDEAYEQSLKADQEKEKERKRAMRKLEEEREEVQRLQRELEAQKEAIEREKERLLTSIPSEPDTNDPDAVQLVIKLPTGSRLERRFLKSHSVQDVHNFVFCHPSAPDSFEILTNFPKRKLDRSDVSLESAGIKRGEVLFVSDLDA